MEHFDSTVLFQLGPNTLRSLVVYHFPSCLISLSFHRGQTALQSHNFLRLLKFPPYFSQFESEVAQSYPTFCDPMDCSLPRSLSLGFSRQEYWSGLPFGGSDGKTSAYNAEDLGSIPELERSPGERNGNPLQDFCLEDPLDGGSW